jgi:hypothetical protein
LILPSWKRCRRVSFLVFSPAAFGIGHSSQRHDSMTTSTSSAVARHDSDIAGQRPPSYARRSDRPSHRGPSTPKRRFAFSSVTGQRLTTHKQWHMWLGDPDSPVQASVGREIGIPSFPILPQKAKRLQRAYGSAGLKCAFYSNSPLWRIVGVDGPRRTLADAPRPGHEPTIRKKVAQHQLRCSVGTAAAGRFRCL